MGKPGKGKTLSMAVVAINFAFKKKKIYSNFDLFLPRSKAPLSSLIVSRQDLEHTKAGKVFIDEIPKWLDSRESFSDDNSFATGVLQKGRKRGNDLNYSAQNLWMCDVRLRENTDYVFAPEVFYRIFPGEETHIKQNFFDPVEVAPLLPYAYIRLYQYDGWTYQNVKMLSMRDVIGIYEFPMFPFVNYYNTREEINELARSEVEKGINDEGEHAKLCELHFKLDDPISINPDSGRGMDSFDFEFELRGQLVMVDSVSVQLIKGYPYLDFTKKHPVKEYFYSTERKRSAMIYLAFYFPKHTKTLYLLPVDSIKEHTSTRLRVNDEVLAKCIKIEPPEEPTLILEAPDHRIIVQETKQIEVPNQIISLDEAYKEQRLKILSSYGF